MTDRITGHGRNGADLAPLKSRATSRNERAGDSDKAEGKDRPEETSRSSHVHLTDTASNLKQAETRLKDLPDVDHKRVETLRQRIESGAYEVNAGRLADRLLAFERDLA